MMCAVSNDIDGIVAECGGSLMCATCHVYVDEAFADRLPAMTPDEDEMLEAAASERLPTSRLSCQIVMSDELDGLVVRLPETQI
jgi:2Fe-2S ferredoxin